MRTHVVQNRIAGYSAKNLDLLDDPTTSFQRPDPFFGEPTEPQSFHKYAYVHDDPVNGTDPTGLWTTLGVMAGITVTATIGSLVLPAIAVAKLSAQGKVSPIQIGKNLTRGKTWLAAAASIVGGGVTSAAMSALVLKAGKKFAARAVPIAGLGFALYGLYESAVMSWRLATEDLPAEDAEEYVSIMFATAILSTIAGMKLKKMHKAGQNNDAAFWEMTPELQNQYLTGQQAVPSRVWEKLTALGMTGTGPDDALTRGGYLQSSYSRGKRMLLAGEGMAEMLKNQALGLVGANPGMTFNQWLNSGLTPDFRWVFGEQGHVVVSSMIATLGFEDNFFIEGWE